MDAGVGRMNSFYHTMESIDNTLSFTDLLSMVVHEAENNKGRAVEAWKEHEHLLVQSVEDLSTQHNVDGAMNWNGINLNNVESGCINNEIMYPDVLTASQEKNKEILLCSELPDESIDTCLFGDSSLVCGSVNGFGDMVKTTGTRSYSTFNNVWIWQDVISRFADRVFEVNRMNEEELEAEIVGAEGTGITNY